ncbi:drug/metabolite transporter (DMT)-like permease [Bradyrhizobium sp. i1.7.7]
MLDSTRRDARPRIAPAGLMFLAITSIGWGFNWPVTKFLLSELPPLTLRGVTGVLGAVLLAALALIRRQSLKVGPGIWPRLLTAAVLNVTGWMVLMGLALLWLPASEAALIAYTMPVWASLIAWPVLGERPTVLRTLGLVMAFVGLASIMGGNGFAASVEKLPGIIMALGGALGFAVGTVFSKKYPIHLPPITAAAWQIGIGCLHDLDHRPLGRDHASFAGDAGRLVAAGLFHRGAVLHCLCQLVRSIGAAAGVSGRDRHHGRACHRRGRLRARAGRAAGAGPDRRADLYTGGRGAGDALVREPGITMRSGSRPCRHSFA